MSSYCQSSFAQSALAPLKQRRVDKVYARALQKEYDIARAWIIQEFGTLDVTKVAEIDKQLERYVQLFTTSAQTIPDRNVSDTFGERF